MLCTDLFLVWCLTPFSTVLKLYRGGLCTYQCFLGVLLLVFRRIFFPSHWLLSHITIVETVDGQWGERTESCRNDYHKSSERILAKPGIEPTTSCSEVLYATPWGLACYMRKKGDAHKTIFSFFLYLLISF